MSKRKTKSLIVDTSTKGRLLSAALMLFAEHGINDVSMRTISAKAGSKNTGASQYHFGDKLGLIEGLLGQISERVWLPGQQRLQEAVLSDADLREILVRGIWPMKMPPYEFDLGAESTLLLLYCAYDHNPTVREMGADCTKSHLWCFYRSVRRLLLNLPEEVFDARWRIFLTEALVGQASRVRGFNITHKVTKRPSWAEHTAYIEALLDFAEAGFRAEIKSMKQAEGLAELRRS